MHSRYIKPLQIESWLYWLHYKSSSKSWLARCLSDEESSCLSSDSGDVISIPGLERSPGVGNGNPLVFLPEKFYGRRSLADPSPWCHKELYKIERAHTHTHTHTQVIITPVHFSVVRILYSFWDAENRFHNFRYLG